MKYLLFCGNDYYPRGGARDFKGSFATLEDAIEAHDPHEYDYDGGWANIFNLDSQKIEKYFDRGLWYDSLELIED